MHRLLLVPVLVVLGSCVVPLRERHDGVDATGPLPSAFATSAATSASPAAQERYAPPALSRRPKNYFDIMFGGAYWDDLGGLDPTGTFPIPGRFDDFDRWGSAFDMGYDRVVWENERDALTVGVETGWSTFANDGIGIASPYSEISASMFYVVPVVRWQHDLSRSVTVSSGIGAGYYGVSFDEYETYYYGWWWGYNSRTLYDDSAFGGFVSLGFDFHMSPWAAFRIDNKLHFVEFNGLQSLMPNETDVHGPIYNAEIGFVFGF